MEFNSDGSLKVIKKKPHDHITIFNLIDELDFPVGRKLLIDILRGEMNSKIRKHSFDNKIYYGSLGGYQFKEISLFIDYLLKLNYLELRKEKGFYTVFYLTDDAKKEMEERECSYEINGITDNNNKIKIKSSPITEKDELIFKEFDFFLKEFTQEQKKAIVDLSPHQICIAGAGSGKTKVLTHKIVYLVKFAGVNPKDILAITFTRKARYEMMTRLSKLLPGNSVRVETFNSFAEKEISYHSLLLYGKDKQMTSSKQFVSLVTRSLNELGYTMDSFLNSYFTSREKINKDQRQMFFSFLYDFSAILETFIRDGKNLDQFVKKSKKSKMVDSNIAKSIVDLVNMVTKKLENNSLRTYADQLVDLIKLYETHDATIKNYKWILVDEYQDINHEQFHLLEIMKPQNLFVVGDPRQSIFAWRGADPERVFTFIKDNTTIMQLTKNFRSTQKIVSFSNSLIGDLGFESIKSNSQKEGSVTITKYISEEIESKSVLNEISALQIPRKEIFILSRTNKGLELLKQNCDKLGIKYLMRTDEKKQSNLEPSEDEITLSTVHAIKGLEAQVIYVIGCNYQNYPCKAKDHRFVELFASTNFYDQIQEEKRLLYVACTRAKDVLRITHTSSLTPFINSDLIKVTKMRQDKLSSLNISNANISKQENALKKWRYLEAKDRNMNSYNIFSDKVLDKILDKQPKTIDDLRCILTNNKLQEFGWDVLAILKKNS